MPLTETEVRSIVSDARIALSDTELSTLTAELNQILQNIDAINELDLTGVQPTYHPLAATGNVMRNDVLAPSLSLSEVFANAKSYQGSQFKVPPILDEMEDSR